MYSRKITAILLAALMLGSSLTACGEEKPKETTGETAAVETNVSETSGGETSERGDTEGLITENGVAASHIVVAEGADELLTYAAEELAAHIKLVSGGEVPVTRTAVENSLPIVIGTPDSVPELETLFADDLAWLRDLGDGDKVRWGDDGFAIRQRDGKLYIFGATARGALNGVYDFIEDNLGVIWTRADESIGTIYDEMPTIAITKTDYREKSPFELRGWSMGNLSETNTLLSRNKLNTVMAGPWDSEGIDAMSSIGIEPFVSSHNVTWWLTNSPSYDPENSAAYFATPKDGDYPEGEVKLVNVWSDLTAQCVADHVLAYLDQYKEAYDLEYLGINMEDFANTIKFTEMDQPYEYAPGEFIQPNALNYFSTVWFSFMNKIADAVAEKYPDMKITSYAYGPYSGSVYWTTIKAPACDLADNLYATFCPVEEDLCAPLGESQDDFANRCAQDILDWMDKTSHVQVYNYYGCCVMLPFYERPIWDRIQSDLQLYAANGLNGLVPEGAPDADIGIYEADWYWRKNPSELRAPYLRMSNLWTMNDMTFWLYSKLAWNPDEDVDALVEYYCDKVYDAASDEMQEYYRILELGWADGRDTMAEEFNSKYTWQSQPTDYWTYFMDIEVDGIYIADALAEALHKAYDAAENDRQRNAIGYRMEIYDNAEEMFNH